MNATNTANTYKRQQIMSASPEELTLMLYNWLSVSIKESMLAIEKKDKKWHILGKYSGTEHSA